MQVLLIYSQADAMSANRLYSDLAEGAHAVRRYPLDSGIKEPQGLSEAIAESEAIVHMVSSHFLRSLECMRELVGVIEADAQRPHYRESTIPVLVFKASDDLDPSDTPGQLALVEFWNEEARKLEVGLNPHNQMGGPWDELREDLMATRQVADGIVRFLRTIANSIYATPYADDPTGATELIGGRLEQIESIREYAEGHALAEPIDAESEVDEADPVRTGLRKLHDGITIASEDDPNKPEFPPFSPRFPATPTFPITVPQLGRSVLLKDESRNITGSHKDRMAWEIVVHYKEVIRDLLEPSSSRATIPQASIISNGSAAMAIQVMMRCYGLPDLKVLIDRRTNQAIVRKLRNAGCEVYIHDLSERELHPSDVLELTENEGGLDFTSRDLVDPDRRTYYDWLAYEILNCGAKHIFIPVGTGDLFVNVLKVVRDELTGESRDPRLAGGARRIEDLSLHGATSEDWKTRMDKLWAQYRPTLDEARRLVGQMCAAGQCAKQSTIHNVNEELVADALQVADANEVRCDASGIAGLALLLEMHEVLEIPTDEEILVVNTGWLALP